MNKQQFLSELSSLLKGVEPSERQEMLYDYEEHIRSAIENGNTEEQAVVTLGKPRLIARELLADAYVKQAERSKNFGSVFRATMAVVGLGFFNLVIVLGPFIGFLGIIAAFYAVAVSFIVAPLAATVGLLIGVIAPGALTLSETTFTFLLLEGLGGLVLVGAIATSRALASVSVRYLRANLRVLKGGH